MGGGQYQFPISAQPPAAHLSLSLPVSVQPPFRRERSERAESPAKRLVVGWRFRRLSPQAGRQVCGGCGGG
ncbi:MAG: hypothetical protein J6T13_03615 [Bacteroidales bacterium]|nr:hypothetical protein [Bacteroidales bacterium]